MTLLTVLQNSPVVPPIVLDFEGGNSQGAALGTTTSTPTLNFATSQTYDSGAAWNGAMGVKAVAALNTSASARFIETTPGSLSPSIAGGFKIDAVPSAEITIFQARYSGGGAIKLVMTAAGLLKTADILGSTSNPITVATGLALNGTKYWVSIRLQVRDATSGYFLINLYDTSLTLLGSATSSTYNLGTQPIIAVDWGIISVTHAAGATSSWDYIELQDNSVTEIMPPVTVLATGIASAETFGTVVATAPMTVSPVGIASPTVGYYRLLLAFSEARDLFGTVTVSNALTVSPVGIGSAEAFGTTVVSGALTVSPTAIGSAEAFGTVVVTLSGGPVTPTGIASAEAFGTVVATATLTVSPTGLGSAEAFGTVTATATLTVSPSGVATAEAFGTVTATATLTVSPTGIATAGAFGTVVVSGALTVSPTGIGSAEGFGTVAVAMAQTASPTGIATGGAFGTVIVTLGNNVSPTGIASAEAFGTVSAVKTLTSSPAGVQSTEAFGTPVITAVVTLLPAGVSTSEAFGTLSAIATLMASPAGIASLQAIGTPVATTTLLVVPQGIVSAAAFGIVLVDNIGTAIVLVNLAARQATAWIMPRDPLLNREDSMTNQYPPGTDESASLVVTVNGVVRTTGVQYVILPLGVEPEDVVGLTWLNTFADDEGPTCIRVFNLETGFYMAWARVGSRIIEGDYFRAL